MKKTTMMTFGAAMILAAGMSVRADDPPTLDQLLDLKPTNPAGVAKPPANKLPQLPDVGPPGESPEALFQRAIDHMKQASDQLGNRLNPGTETQRLERNVMALMDKVIADAENQQSSSSSSSSSSSGGKPKPGGQQQNGSSQNQGQAEMPGQGNKPGEKPGGKPQPNSGGGGGITPGGNAPKAADLGPLDLTKAGWGNLPERTRQAILNGGGDRQSAVYSDLTEEYYKTLGDLTRPGQ